MVRSERESTNENCKVRGPQAPNPCNLKCLRIRKNRLSLNPLDACSRTTIYVPGSGWVEFDPTNGIVGNRDLIRVGVARTPQQAIPLSGSYWGDADEDLGMEVAVNVKTEDGSAHAKPVVDSPAKG
jgi:transglutaminase-like putative cysteine protease